MPDALANFAKRVFEEPVRPDHLVPEDGLPFLQPPPEPHRDAVGGAADTNITYTLCK